MKCPHGNSINHCAERECVDARIRYAEENAEYEAEPPEECGSCLYTGAPLTLYGIGAYDQPGLDGTAHARQKHEWLCEVCASTQAGSAYANRNPHADILRMIAWGINYSRDQKGSPVTNKVRGFCPMGCGRTLYLENGVITCSDPGCPEPTAVDVILSDPDAWKLDEGDTLCYNPLPRPRR